MTLYFDAPSRILLKFGLSPNSHKLVQFWAELWGWSGLAIESKNPADSNLIHTLFLWKFWDFYVTVWFIPIAQPLIDFPICIC